jgi:peptide-methionine (S)-S-oxide reductase
MTEISDAKIWLNPIVTEITALDEFFRAEDYHQNYFKNNPNQGYCQAVIAPKVAKFRKQYVDRLKIN